MAEAHTALRRQRPEPSSVSVLVSATRTRLVLAGEMDLTAQKELDEAIREVLVRGQPVEIDTRNVQFMDSSVVASLGRLAQQLPDRPTLIDPPELVRFLLDVTKLSDVVEIVDSDPGFPGTQAGVHGAGPA